MNRTAPEGGYDFQSKALYRSRVWNHFRKFCRTIGERSPTALLMPSSEGIEIDVARNKGFRDLHVVDRNPAIVAHLKRRYPTITTYGVDLADAIDRMHQHGIRLTVANLDLTATVAAAPLLAATAMLMSPITGGMVGFNSFRGREPKYLAGIHEVAQERTIAPLWGDLPHTDAARLSHIWTITDILLHRYEARVHIRPIEADIYQSASASTMLWSVWVVLPGSTTLPSRKDFK